MRLIPRELLECTVLKLIPTVSKQFAADTFGEEYSQLLLDKINKFQGYYDENGNLYNEGHRFFLIKMHLKYLGKNTSKIQFDSPIICKYPDGTYYSLGGIDYIDKSLLENESHHITINPGDEFDSWFLYEAYRYSHDKTCLKVHFKTILMMTAIAVTLLTQMVKCANRPQRGVHDFLP